MLQTASTRVVKNSFKTFSSVVLRREGRKNVLLTGGRSRGWQQLPFSLGPVPLGLEEASNASGNGPRWGHQVLRLRRQCLCTHRKARFLRRREKKMVPLEVIDFLPSPLRARLHSPSRALSLTQRRRKPFSSSSSNGRGKNVA